MNRARASLLALEAVNECDGMFHKSHGYTQSMDRTFIDRLASDVERRRARDIAQAVLDGRTTILEAARALFSLAHTDAVPDVEDGRLIIAVESQTDHLPVGEVRKLWAPDALKDKDADIARAEAFYRDEFSEACQRIVAANCSSDRPQ